MSYTNPTSSNWNPDFYSKQVGGDKYEDRIIKMNAIIFVNY